MVKMKIDIFVTHREPTGRVQGE